MYIVLDIGGTNTRISASESLDDVKFFKEVSIETSQEYYEGEKNIIKAIKNITPTVTAIGIGLPGSIDSQGVLDGSTNLPDWVGKPLKVALEQDFHCPVFIKNDAEIGALGEAYYGAGKESSFLYLTWGTGVGVAQIYWQSGAVSASRPANRQSVYDFEKLIGGKDIETRFGVKAEDLNDERWEIVFKDLTDIIPALANEYGFSRVVLGGGIAVQKKTQLEEVLAESCGDLVSVTDLAGQAGLYGALGLCKNVQVCNS